LSFGGGKWKVKLWTYFLALKKETSTTINARISGVVEVSISQHRTNKMQIIVP